jgi:hypothetical protein
VRAAAVQPGGVVALGVQSVGGDDRVGQVDSVQKRGEHGDFVRLRCHLDLPEHDTGRMVERGQQVLAWIAAGGRAAQRLAIHRDPPPRTGR